MSAEISMPQQSDTMIEGTVVKWSKKEGDRVKSGEVVGEIETDKAVMELESSQAGTIAHIAVNEGTKVPVGTVLAALATGQEDPAEVKKKYVAAPAAPAAQAKPAAAPAAAAAPALKGAVRSPSHAGGTMTLEHASMSEIHEPDEVGHGATREAATAVPPVPAGGNGRRILVSPLARRVATDKGVDLKLVNGSGPGGRIVQRDVLDFAARPPAPAQPAAGPQKPVAPQVERVPRGETETIPHTKMRKAIAPPLYIKPYLTHPIHPLQKQSS